jgi:predicted nucleic acid-binding protein
MQERFVLDNSIVMSWCFQDEASEYADAALDSLETSEAIVPSIWPLEVANVLLVAERKRRLSRADTARFVSLVRSLPILVEDETPDRILGEILSLAREYGLSSYDASYLDLAIRTNLPIATLDQDLRKAAKRCGVPLWKAS